MAVHAGRTAQGATLPGGGDASDRHRPSRDPVHLGQHRQAQGRRAEPPQPDRRRREREHLPGNTSDDVILSVLPLSFDAGLSQVTTAFSVGAHCVLMNYLLPREVPKLCEQYGVTGLTGVPPLWLQLARRALAGGARPQRSAVLGEHGRTDAADRPSTGFGASSPRPTRTSCTASPRRSARPTSTRPRSTVAPTRSARPSPTPRSSCSARTARRAIPEKRANSCTAARSSRSATGTTRSAPRNGTARAPPGQEWRAPEMAVWSGDTVVADEEGFLYFVGRSDEMIKTSGYRVSPTEIEEAAYGTGLVRDAVAIGVDDCDARPAHRPGRDPDAPELDVDGSSRRPLRQQLPAVHGPVRRSTSATSCPARPTASSTATSSRRRCPHEAPRTHRRVRHGRRRAAGRRDAADPAGRPRRVDAVLRLRPRPARRARRPAACGAALTRGTELRDEGEPDARGRAAPRAARRPDRRGLRRSRCRPRSTPTIRPDRVSFAGPGKTPAEIRQAVAAGIIVEIESTTEFGRVIAAGDELGRHAERRRAGEPGLRREGVGHADGRRPAAVRDRRRAGAGGAARVSPRGSGCARVPRLRRLAEPERRDHRRSAATHRRPGHRAGRAPSDAACATSTWAAGSASPTPRRDQPLDLDAVAEQLHDLVDGADRRSGSPRRAR